MNAAKSIGMKVQRIALYQFPRTPFTYLTSGPLTITFDRTRNALEKPKGSPFLVGGSSCINKLYRITHNVGCALCGIMYAMTLGLCYAEKAFQSH